MNLRKIKTLVAYAVILVIGVIAWVVIGGTMILCQLNGGCFNAPPG